MSGLDIEFSIRAPRAWALAALVGASVSAHAGRYTLIDLGSDFTASAIDNRGEITGRTLDTQQPVVYRHGSWQPLKIENLCNLTASATSINVHGDIAGTCGEGIPVVWPRQGHPHAIAVPSDNNGYAQAAGLANDGTVAGFYIDGADIPQCFVTTPDGVSVNLGVGGEDGCAVGAVGPSGLVAGQVFNADQTSSTFIWSHGAFTYLGGLAGQVPSASTRAIDKQGRAVGEATFGSTGHAFLWDGTAMIDIGSSKNYVETWATAINGRGEIVGVGSDAQGQPHALRFGEGRIVLLEDQVDDLDGCYLEYANGLNESGVVVGTMIKDSVPHAFLLVPK